MYIYFLSVTRQPKNLKSNRVYTESTVRVWTGGAVPIPWDHKTWVSFKTLSTGDSIGTVGKRIKERVN
jgi:hypothetical protein